MKITRLDRSTEYLIDGIRIVILKGAPKSHPSVSVFADNGSGFGFPTKRWAVARFLLDHRKSK